MEAKVIVCQFVSFSIDWDPSIFLNFCVNLCYVFLFLWCKFSFGTAMVLAVTRPTMGTGVVYLDV